MIVVVAASAGKACTKQGIRLGTWEGPNPRFHQQLAVERC